MRIGFEFYLQFYFASLYNLRNASFEDTAEVYSIIVSIVWQILLLTLLFSVVVVLFKFKKKYREEGIKESRVRILLEDFKDNKKIVMLDHVIFMLRRIFLSYLIIFGWGYGLTQAIIFLVVCILVLISKLILRPYKSSILNVQSIAFEFILCAVLWILCTFWDKSTEFSDSGSANTRGMACFGLVWSIMIISYIFTFILFVSYWCKRKKQKNNVEVKPKIDINTQNINKPSSKLFNFKLFKYLIYDIT